MERWLAHFPREQCLILAYEEFFSDLGRAFPTICLHLGIRPWAPDREERRNIGSYRAMDPVTRAKLKRLHEPANQQLFSLLGRSLPWD